MVEEQERYLWLFSNLCMHTMALTYAHLHIVNKWINLKMVNRRWVRREFAYFLITWNKEYHYNIIVLSSKQGQRKISCVISLITNGSIPHSIFLIAELSHWKYCINSGNINDSMWKINYLKSINYFKLSKITDRSRLKWSFIFSSNSSPKFKDMFASMSQD